MKKAILHKVMMTATLTFLTASVLRLSKQNAANDKHAATETAA